MALTYKYTITSTGSAGSIALTSNQFSGTVERNFDGLRSCDRDPVAFAAVEKYLTDGSKTGTVTLSAA